MDEKVSTATVRNELVALENEGFIFQPHTSAGRVPTEKAYQFYIENYLDKARELTKKEQAVLAEIKKEEVDDRVKVKNFAQAIADLAKQGVMVTFAECDNYYTGLSNIFGQPEFHDKESVVNLSAVVEHLDKKLKEFAEKDFCEPQVLIGKENPIGCNCTLIVFKYQLGKFKGIIGLLGPTRMDYQKNYALVKESVKLLK
jgi:transcriptional regulator of heat shock response